MLQPLLDSAELELLSTLWANSLIALSSKALLLLAFAGGASFLLRRRAAATRHAVWTASVLALLVLPALAALLPSLAVSPLPDWKLEAEPTDTSGGDVFFVDDSSAAKNEFLLAPVSANLTRVPFASLGRSDDDAAPRLSSPGTVVASLSNSSTFLPRDASFTVENRAPALGDSIADLFRSLGQSIEQWSPKTWALLAWELGVFLVMAWFAMGTWRVSRLKSRCHAEEAGVWPSVARDAANAIGLRRVPRILWTQNAWTPLTLGVLRPVVILPVSARDWSRAQCYEVLLHEFAHVQRRDILTQCLAQVACALFWFHPLPWIAAGRMRLERERACDDRVLMAGSRASTYASHLLEMARSLRFESSLATASVAMARRSQLGERMESLLDRRPRGRKMGSVARVAVVSLAAALVLPLAAMRPAPPKPPQAEPPAALVLETTPNAPDPAASTIGGVVAVPKSPSPPRTARRHLARVHRSPRVAPVLAFVPDDDDRDQGDYTIVWDHGNFQSNDDHEEWRVSAEGRIRFAPTEDAIEWIEDGGSFELEHRDRDTNTRHLVEFDGRGDDGFDVHYSLNSRSRPYDDEAKAWFATALPEFFDRSAVVVKSRTERWLSEGGVDRAVDRLAEVKGGWSLGIYARALLHRLDRAEDRRRVVDSVIERVDAGFSRSSLLQEAAPDYAEDAHNAALWLHWVGGLDSDFAIAQSISGLSESTQLSSPVVALALQSSDTLESDFMKAQVLLGLVAYVAEDPELTEPFFRVADELQSDFQYQQVLRALESAQAGH